MKSHAAPPVRPSDGGFALVATLAVLMLVSAVAVVVFSTSLSSFRAGVTDLEKVRTAYAAEGAAEHGMAQIALALADGALTDEEVNSLNAPSIDGFAFDSFEVVKVGAPYYERITDGEFAGLTSLTQAVEITAQASSNNATSSKIKVAAKAQSMPVFQFGVFYDKDLEVHPGATMHFDGWVHSNSKIYLSGKALEFHDMITTPNQVYWGRKDKNEVINGVNIDDASGTGVLLSFDSQDTPDPNVFRAKSDASFDNRLMTDAYDVDSLKVPLPDGVEVSEVLRPRDEEDVQLERDAKLAWKADWYIEVNAGMWQPYKNNKNPGVSICQGGMTHTRTSGLGSPSQAECEAIFTYTGDAFYEFREQRYVDILDIDIAALQAWATGSNATETIYITINTSGAYDGKSDGTFPVVRVHSGATLTSPLTVSTEHPMYLWGDWNTGTWQPSSVMGDAITFLSNSWSDAQHQNVGVLDTLTHIASNTTTNVCILAGHSPTECDYREPGCGIRAPYGGGLENYFRFLETWRGKRLTFRGSIVSLHFSEQAVGPWKGGFVVYIAPLRDYAFDTTLEDIANMPPGVPHVGNVVHTAFRPVF